MNIDILNAYCGMGLCLLSMPASGSVPSLYVQYKEGTDLYQKQEEGRDKYPIEVTASKWEDGVIFSGLMSIKNVETVCSDPDIVRVTGKVSPRHN